MKKKSNVGLIVGIVVAALCLCCGIGGFAAYKGINTVMHGAGNMLGCGNTLGDYRNAVLAYAKKHNGKLPQSETWQDDVKPFLVKTDLPGILKSDSKTADPDTYCDFTAPSSVCYNKDFAGKTLSSLDPSSELIILFESPGSGKNKSAKFEVLPFATSPKLFGAESRGWIQQPLYGDAFLIGKNGQKSPVPKTTQTSSSVHFGN